MFYEIDPMGKISLIKFLSAAKFFSLVSTYRIFTTIIFYWAKKVRVFVLGRPLSALSNFCGYDLKKVLHSRVGSWPYPQTFILGWKGRPGIDSLAYFTHS
jgi:hypothetical protein